MFNSRSEDSFDAIKNKILELINREKKYLQTFKEIHQYFSTEKSSLEQKLNKKDLEELIDLYKGLTRDCFANFSPDKNDSIDTLTNTLFKKIISHEFLFRMALLIKSAVLTQHVSLISDNKKINNLIMNNGAWLASQSVIIQDIVKLYEKAKTKVPTELEYVQAVYKYALDLMHMNLENEKKSIIKINLNITNLVQATLTKINFSIAYEYLKSFINVIYNYFSNDKKTIPSIDDHMLYVNLKHAIDILLHKPSCGHHHSLIPTLFNVQSSDTIQVTIPKNGNRLTF